MPRQRQTSMAKGVLKEVTKLSKIPHPRSRKTAQLARKAIRSSNRDKTKNANLMKQNLLGEKFMWFKERIQSSEVTPSNVLQLIEGYLGRFDEELEQIQIKHSVGRRKGRQHASREDSIRSTIKHEMHEFNTCGIEMPDLLNGKQLALLMKWEGEIIYLQNFKLVRYSRSQLENMIRKSKSDEQNDEGKPEKNQKVDSIGKEDSGDEKLDDENKMDTN